MKTNPRPNNCRTTFGRFSTETLEFIYGASELLLCGWDSGKSIWDERHPLGGYVNSYDDRRSMVLGLK